MCTLVKGTSGNYRQGGHSEDQSYLSFPFCFKRLVSLEEGVNGSR